MNVFDENEKRVCCCHIANNIGIFNMSNSNEAFSIYGNITCGRSILLNYKGKLINNSLDKIPNIYLYYCFDNDWNNKKIYNMNICNSHDFKSCCAIILIPDREIKHINIAFANDNDEWDTDISSTYLINVYPDVEKNIINRYNLNSAPSVIIEKSNYPSAYSDFKSSIRLFFNNIGNTLKCFFHFDRNN